MLIDGIQSAVSGLKASEKKQNVSANNVANASTPGYQPARVEQASVAGGGVEVTGLSYTGSTGGLMTTDNSLDLAINGGGFFVLDGGNGGQLYTRSGNFTINAQGQITDQIGRALVPNLQIPDGTANISVSSTGQLQALAADGTVLADLQIQTASFGNPGGLESVGGNAYQATEASGPAVNNFPGQAGHGEIVSGALQTSGTDLAREMVDQIINQRSFEANIKTIQTYDDMVGSVLDIKT